MSWNTLPPDCYELLAGFLRYKDLVRVSITCRDAWHAYFQIQSRVRELRAKNIDNRRKRAVLLTQLRATTGLEVLSLVNVQHPCTARLFHQVASMTRLRELDLSRSHLQGFLPDFHLPDLQRLNLSNNALVGPLPPFTHCPQLTEIVLSFNKFEGSIPQAWTRLTALRIVSLSYNSLSGSFSALSTLPHLESLLLGGNQFTSIPEELGTECHALKKVLLAGNKLTGTLPAALGKCERLEQLIVSSNFLEGEVPYALERCESLHMLDLAGNKFDELGSRQVLRVMKRRDCQVFM